MYRLRQTVPGREGHPANRDNSVELIFDGSRFVVEVRSGSCVCRMRLPVAVKADRHRVGSTDGGAVEE
jgi:hypothetical protein